jgi:DNA-binding XRE family transcriptional regulator
MEENKKGLKTKGGESGDQKKSEGANNADASATSSKKAQSDVKTSKPSEEKKDSPRINNRLREFRIERMMSKAELARKAGLSVLTVARIEKGYGCRMDTKRKILKALGLKLSDRRKLFEDE